MEEGYTCNTKAEKKTTKNRMLGRKRTFGIFVSLMTFICGLQDVVVASDTPSCSIVNRFEFHCFGESVPTLIPNGVKNVTLKGINLNTFIKGQFGHRSWDSVVYLDIQSTHGAHLFAEVFTGLNSLTNFKLKASEMESFDVFSMHGLPMVERLDLADNVFLGIYDVLQVLNDDVNKTLPLLKWLNIASLQSWYTTPVALTENAFKILSRRGIEYLDLSDLNIVPFDVRGMKSMCGHLKHLVLRDTVITEPKAIVVSYTCESLRTVDARNLTSIDLMQTLKFVSTIPSLAFFLGHIFRPLCNVELLLMSNVFQKEKVGEVTLTLPLDLYNVPLSLRHLDMSQNNIRLFNSTVVLHPKTVGSFRELDFSNNGMEYLSPNVLRPSVNIERVNLSRNSLHKMLETHNNDFVTLFQPLANLKTIDLSYNGLTHFTQNMFLNNTRLERILISNNKLSTIDFRFNQLINLRVIDLRGNIIEVIQAETIREFQHMTRYVKHGNWSIQHVDHSRTMTNDIHLKVLLRENPLVCKCEEEYLVSLKWIENSGFVPRESTLSCTLHGDNLPIFHSALTKTKDYCHRREVMRAILITGCVTAALIAIGAGVTFLVRRRRAKRDGIKQFTKLIRAGDKLKNLIFLSFCNEDGDYVLENIYPKIKEEASKSLQCERNLVCCGDLNFRPGMSVCLEAMRCIEESAVVIFVVTNTFCQKSWCKMEVDTANAQRKPVILLMLEMVNPDVMTPYIKKLFSRYTRASWIHDSNGGHPHPPWPVLISSVIELGSRFNTENKINAQPELNGGLSVTDSSRSLSTTDISFEMTTAL